MAHFVNSWQYSNWFLAVYFQKCLALGPCDEAEPFVDPQHKICLKSQTFCFSYFCDSSWPMIGPMLGELPELAGVVRSFEEALQHWNQQVQAGGQVDQDQARKMNEAG